MRAAAQDVRIAGEDGLELEGVLDERVGAPAVVVCHPHPAFGGRMTAPMVLTLHHALLAAGLTSLRFNFRGLDGSTGTATGGLREHVDVASAVAFLRQRAPSVAVVGYSFGALMAARAIGLGLAVSSLAAVGFPTTIIGDDAERLADIGHALDVGQPSLFIQGDDDQFCRLPQIADWARGRPGVTVETLPGIGHFPDDAEAAAIGARVAVFTLAAFGRA